MKVFNNIGLFGVLAAMFFSPMVGAKIAYGANSPRELVEITSPHAVCNNGERANYMIERAESGKWLVFFEGGGAAGNAGEYIKRANKGYQIKPLEKASWVASAIHDHFAEMGFNSVFVHNCSSDLFQGDHFHRIKGENVPFKGRRIVEGLLEDLHKELQDASLVVFGGSSAGAVSLGFNVDILSQYKNVRIISDSFWFDKETLGWFTSVFLRNRDRINWIYNNMPDHCLGKLKNCFPHRSLFTKNGLDDVFIIWNFGDAYQRSANKEKVKEAIKADLKHYQAGFSADATKIKINAFGKGGHVMTMKIETYNQIIGGVTLKALIEGWIKDRGNKLYLGY